MIKKWREETFVVPELNREATEWARLEGVRPLDLLVTGVIVETEGVIQVETVVYAADGYPYRYGQGGVATKFVDVMSWPPAHLIEDIAWEQTA